MQTQRIPSKLRASVLCLLGAAAFSAPALATESSTTAAAAHEPILTEPPAVTEAPAVEPTPKPVVASPNSDNAGIIFPGWPLKIGASFFTRFELREGYDRLGVSRGRFTEGEQAVYRARLRFDTAPIDIGGGQQVVLRFAPQVDGAWGNQPSTVSNPNLGVNEAYLRLQNDLFELDLGHFMMDYGDALMIGNLGWHQTARTFDGGRIRVQPGDAKYWVDFFFTQLSEGLGGLDADPFAGDAFFTGLYADFGKLLSDKTVLEPYLLGQIWAAQDVLTDPTDPTAGTTTRTGAVQGTFGFRAKQTYGMIDLRLEAGLQFGKRRVGVGNPDVFAYHFDAEVGVKPMKGLRLSLEGLYASGDDPDTVDKNEGWAQLFPTAHKFLGLMDVIGGRSNIASGVVHVAYKGIDKLVLKLDGHIFVRPQTVMDQKGYAGTELDLNVIYILGKGLKLRVMYAVFIPGSDHYFVGGNAADEPAHYVETQFGYAF